MRAGPLAAAVAVLALAFLGPGCAREAPDVHEARLAANRYLNALAKKDVDELRARSTCVVAMQWIRGGNVLQIGPVRRLALGMLDSLVMASARAHQTADSIWMRGSDEERETLFQASRRTGALEAVYRNAIRAANLSDPTSLQGSSSVLETRAIRVRIRYAGEPVGPRPVDREEVLRLVRVPTGKWIVFSLYTTEDDPHPDKV
jgi:hypothetical protein